MQSIKDSSIRIVVLDEYLLSKKLRNASKYLSGRTIIFCPFGLHDMNIVSSFMYHSKNSHEISWLIRKPINKTKDLQMSIDSNFYTFEEDKNQVKVNEMYKIGPISVDKTWNIWTSGSGFLFKENYQ